jgi:hypothetical protein
MVEALVSLFFLVEETAIILFLEKSSAFPQLLLRTTLTLITSSPLAS